MRTLTFWSTFISFLAIATGNLAYMRYRASIDFGGARAWLKENLPISLLTADLKTLRIRYADAE